LQALFCWTNVSRQINPMELNVSSAIACSEIDMKKDNEQIVETAVEARGGRLGRPVLLVLIVSVALTIAFMVFSYIGTPKL
jgi:hypothetical protein